jgi:tetratricopeptide (TPR) repeat protein
MSNFKDLANNSFFKRDYKRALLNYSLALKEKPDDTEAKIGALLADMAFEKEDEAVALFEYYEVTKAIDAKNAHETIERIIQNVDERNDPLYDILSTIEERISVIEDGILYEEFIAHVNSRENIKLALEDLIFSTKIIIYKKEDFVELIGMLLDNGYDEMAYNYIESALALYPDDRLFYDFLQTLEQN